ncbi:IPT/TIG domain-containing protein [Streptomyces sp. NPDC013178]|uniref:IPT/TIG domain-containing protein n=1 Tax=Streptomyces sp. NPDC013178 TaxID=3155118 RepID=UPI0033E6E9C5
MSPLTSPRPLAAAAMRSPQTAALLSSSDVTIPVGDSPLGVAVAPDGGRAYVANRMSNTVSVIDTATDTVTATIATGAGPSMVAFSPDGTRAYVTLNNDGTVGVIDTTTLTVTATVPVGAGAVGVAVTPDGSRIYVTSQAAGVVSVINAATLTVVGTLAAAAPVGVAVSPDGTRAYVACTGDGTVSVIDTATDTIISSILVGDVPVLVAFAPDGARAYVSTAGEHVVRVIDTATDTVTASIPVGTGPRVVAVSPDGAAAYVACIDDNAVTVIDTASNTATGSLPVGQDPTGVALSPDGARLYVTNTADGTVSVIALTLVPDQGSTAGGTVVIIRGHGLAGVTAVRFGTRTATILANTATSVTVRVPAGAGVVPVTVTAPGGTAGFGTFVYRPAPVLTGITVTSSPFGGGGPPMGPYSGGGTAVITGFNLAGTTSVRFGNRTALIQSATDTAVTVEVPGVPSPGPAAVTVITPGGSVGGLTYTYLDLPAVTAVDPTAGPTSGGTEVTFTGTQLATTQTVTFDNIPVPFTVISDQQITATAPPHSAGSGVTITVTTLGGISSWNDYTYVTPAAI